MTPVAPRIVNNVSCVKRSNHDMHFSWQAQHLVKFKCHFSWQAQHLVKFKCHFSWQAQYFFVGVGHSLWAAVLCLHSWYSALVEDCLLWFAEGHVSDLCFLMLT